FANGRDCSLVAPKDFSEPVKSVGNSHTCVRDLKTDLDVKNVLYALSESVGARLMEQGFLANTIEFTFCTSDMTKWGTRQRKIAVPTCLSKQIADTAYSLFRESYGDWRQPLRKIGVRGCDLVSIDTPRQLTLFEDVERTDKSLALERSVNRLRERFGNKIIQRGVMLLAPELSGVDAKRDHTIHPVGVFTGGVSVNWGGYTTKITE
ncbi:MAG: DNA polymerase IV, partial [Oscillospiraceae bacterium]|nr:DNA polymerase IV [Oscillospiraceae bacterium]